jgi:ABC-2 type transport system permease protein
MSARRALLIGLTEVKLLLADRGALLFSLLLPLAIVALLIGAFGGENEFNGTAHIVDRDNGPYGNRLLDGLRQVDGLDVDLLDPDEARDKLDRSNILLYFEIPEDFSERLERAEPAEIVVYRRGNGGQEGQIVTAIVQDVAGDVVAPSVLARVTRQLLEAAGVPGITAPLAPIAEQTWQESRAQPLLTVASRAPEGEEAADVDELFFPRIAAWMVLFAVTLNAQSIVEERRRGTLERLLTTRATTRDILAGKFLGNYLRGALQIVVLFAVAVVAFDFFTLGSFLRSLAFGAVMLLAISGLGLLVAAIARTPDQATTISVFGTMLMALFGGTFLTGELGEVFGIVRKLTVTHWMNTGFDRIIIDGGGLLDVATSIAVMLGIFAVSVVASALLFVPLPEGRSR